MGTNSSKIYACDDESGISDVVDDFVNHRIENVIRLKSKPDDGLLLCQSPSIGVHINIEDANSGNKPPLSSVLSVKSKRSYLSINSLSSFACRHYLKQENSYIPNEAVSFSLRKQSSVGKSGFENSWKSSSDNSESLYAINESANNDNANSNPVSNYNKRSSSKLEIQDDADWIPVSDDEYEMDNSIEESYSNSMNSMIIFENKGLQIPVSTAAGVVPPLVLNNHPVNTKPNLAPTFNKPPQLVLNVNISLGPAEGDALGGMGDAGGGKKNGLHNNQSYLFTHSGTMLVDGLGAAIGKTGMQHTNMNTLASKRHVTAASLAVSLPMKERLIVICKLGCGASSIVYKVFYFQLLDSLCVNRMCCVVGSGSERYAAGGSQGYSCV